MSSLGLRVNKNGRWFQRRLLRWFEKHRRDLPWRKTRDPYKILVSEIMLQQTQVDRVIPKYRAFLREFPTASALAKAPTAAVIRAWSGLGYNRRAVYLKQAAETVVKMSLRAKRSNLVNGEGIATLPSVARNDEKEIIEYLQKLPGVGKYTARAVAAFAFGQDVAAMDTNGKRVVHRWFHSVEVPKLKVSEQTLWNESDALVPTGKGWMWNHAMMDFGALVCTKKKPKCMTCPMQDRCTAYPRVLNLRNQNFRNLVTESRIAERFVGSTRYWRGRIIELLRHATGHSLAYSQVVDLLGSGITPTMLTPLLAGLAKDRLIMLRRSRVALPR